MSIGVLHNIAKSVNPAGYKAWRGRHNKYISLKTLDNGENDVAQHVSTQLFEKVKYCQKQWYYCHPQTNLWVKSECPLTFVISFLQLEISYSRSFWEAKLEQMLEEAVQKQDEKDATKH
ncbi:hypothetical protein EON65_17385 [archaeon]|nr:MAG: hypothetical protein EON65_17385 [archaeon]